MAKSLHESFIGLPARFEDTAELAACLREATQILKDIPAKLDEMRANDIWAIQGATVAYEWLSEKVIPQYNGWLEEAKRLKKGNKAIDSARLLEPIPKEPTEASDLDELVSYFRDALHRLKTLAAVLEGDEGVESLEQKKVATKGLSGAHRGAKEGCFIATATMGQPDHEVVRTLRAFRDRHLLGNAAGSFFVGVYYAASPKVAEVIARYPLARATSYHAVVRPIHFVAKRALGNRSG